MPFHGILRSLRDKSLEKNQGCLYLYSVEKASMKEIGNLPSTSLSPSAEQSDSCHFGRQGPPCRGIMYLHAVDWLWSRIPRGQQCLAMTQRVSAEYLWYPFLCVFLLLFIGLHKIEFRIFFFSLGSCFPEDLSNLTSNPSPYTS